MAYREKLAWLTMGTMLVAYTIYFGFVGPAVDFGRTRLIDVIWSFGAVASAHAVAVVVGTIAIAAGTPKEGRSPPDERDRAIARRSSTIGYYVLLVGMMLVGMVMPFTEPAWKIVNAALLAIVVAELIRDAIILLGYRRGWHA
jgi:uncharacterized BrkB/YihY/UPF0761 family membrane protein